MVKIVWTDFAINDLNEIGNFISENSVRYAEITVDKLFKSVEILVNNCFVGRVVPEFEDETIRELIRGNYRVVYRIVDDFRIDVITVNSCAKPIENSDAFLNDGL
ncbi:MAG: type II toxin-antitoxin system RelE/ParE family toxin [Sphingobacteriales bacterium]|nr:MAG: type II toxin-antitoxin system RelE/ParE family toxin [Sphingobacteriales bacterium]